LTSDTEAKEMFANLVVKESLEKVAGDWDFLQEKVLAHFSTFKAVGQNIYGIRRRYVGAAGIVDPQKGAISRHFEIGPQGKIEVLKQPLEISVTTSGTPHHVTHNFGYWHVNDMDELYLRLPGETPDALGYSLVIMGNPSGDECDRFAWYCERCLTILFERVCETGRLGFDVFWKSERQAVTDYNRDVANRTCPECGFINPRGYCWAVSKDNPEEREARAVW
jgi:hypothetical protein